MCQEEDMPQRTLVETVSDSATPPQTISFRDMVLHSSTQGVHEDDTFKLSNEDILKLVTEELGPDLKQTDEEDLPPTPLNLKPEAKVTLEEYENWCAPWQRTLIVCLLGRKVSLKYMTIKIQHLWAKRGTVKVVDISNDFFMVSFSDDGDYRHALLEGPWLILDHYLLVQRWRPFFRPNHPTVKRIAAWVRIPGLPIEFCNDDFLWRVGALLGTMLKVDHHTSIYSRGKFARICVELDLRRELVPSFTVLGAEFKLEYEGLHMICFGCGRYNRMCARL